MAGTISQRELRNDSGEVLRRVEAGETFTVTRRGVPVADLVPHRPRANTRRGVEPHLLVEAMAGLPRWDLDAFAREREQLDAIVDDDDRDPWP